MNQTHEKSLFTPKQVAEMLGYKVASIYAFLSRQELHASKVGRSRFISEQQLNDFILSRSEKDGVIDYTK